MNDEQLLRYSRHIFLPEIDIKGQEKLLASQVLIIGLGGLGSPVALYLAASGVGRLLLADRDKVELSNLQRQIIHTTASISKDKTHSAAQTLHALNPETQLILIDDLTEETIDDYLKTTDCVIDGSDNFKTRFAVNRACVQAKVPLISGAAINFTGQLCVFDFKQQDSPCYQCLYPDGMAEETRCQDSGVIAPLVGVIGSLQALEAIKILVGLHETSSQLLQVDARNMQFRSTKITKDINCSVCEL